MVLQSLSLAFIRDGIVKKIIIGGQGLMLLQEKSEDSVLAIQANDQLHKIFFLQ